MNQYLKGGDYRAFVELMGLSADPERGALRIASRRIIAT
jgi:hypothetical protein